MIRTKFAAALAFTAARSWRLLRPRTSRLMPYTKAPPMAAYAPVTTAAGFNCRRPCRRRRGRTRSWTNTADTTAVRRSCSGPGSSVSARRPACLAAARSATTGRPAELRDSAWRQATISGMDNHGTAASTRVFGARDDVFSWRTNWMATITGRGRRRREQQSVYVEGRLCRRRRSQHGGLRCGSAASFGSGSEYAMAQRLDGSARAGNTALPRTGLSASNTTTRLSRPKGYQLAGTAPRIVCIRRQAG